MQLLALVRILCSKNPHFMGVHEATTGFVTAQAPGPFRELNNNQEK